MVFEIYFDGGTRGNRFCVVKNGEKPIVKVFPHPQTNNQLEYTGLINALRLAKKKFSIMDMHKVFIKGDSEVVIKHMHSKDNDGYECRSPRLLDLHEQTVELMNELMFNPDTNLIWVPRDENLAGRVLEK